METERSEGFVVSPAVDLTDVGFAFRTSAGGFTPVLKSVTLRLEYGQVVGIVGRNGAGKTTLLNIIRGELVPQIGRVTVGGTVVSSGGHRMRIPAVSLISQKPDVSLAPSMTVYENFIMASRDSVFDLRTAYSGILETACTDLLSRANIGLESKLNEQVRFLSGGQQQALSVLLALRSPERVLLMDEPIASLDSYAAGQLFEMALREARSSQALVLIVSHGLRDLIDRCERIVVLSGGLIVFSVVRGEAGWNEESLSRLLLSEWEAVKPGGK